MSDYRRMSDYNRKKRDRARKKRRRVFIIEMIVLVVLTVVLFVTIWATQKLSLVNHVELDPNKVHTSDEVNAQAQGGGPNNVDVAAAGTAEASSSAEAVSTPEPTQAPAQENSLSGIDVIALVGLDTRPDEADIQNSDTMIIAVLNHNDKTIKLCSVYRDTYLNIGDDYYGNPDYYTKANEAYNYGGAAQFLSMLNLNLDLNMTEFITVHFNALAKTIDLLGGIDIDMTYEEVVHLNNYNVETAAVCGVPYEEIPLPDISEFYGTMTRTFHCNGTQAVSYARIRYTSGNDFRRASRQRRVLQLVKEKASTVDFGTLDQILNAVLPEVTTNMDNMKLLSLAGSVLTYSLGPEDQTGFPFVHVEDDGSITGTDCVIPITLSYNVKLLHEFLFPGVEYTPSYTVDNYSYAISMATGYGEAAIEIYSEVEDNAEIPYWTQEMYDQMIAENSGGGEDTGYTEEAYEGY